MTRLFVLFFILLVFSCNTKQTHIENENVAAQSAVIEQELQINATLLEVRESAKKFMILALIQNETGVTSFSMGDTVTLYPNLIRRENADVNAKSSDNEHMSSLQSLTPNSSFSATIKIRGKGDSRYGLIMNWEK
jgi:hypothetical protein